MAVSFKDHMKDRAFMMDRCEKATIGKDFAVFEFESKFDLEKALKFCDACNKLYKYTFDTNLTNKLVCFNKV